MDELRICDRCGSDAAYVQEVNDKIKNYMCYGCGFITNSLMKKGTDFFKEQMEVLPNLYKELMGEDKEGKIWMPSTVNKPSKGMIFADGTNIDNWMWAAVKAVKIKEEERKNYPIPNTENQYYEWKMDMETKKHFPEREYIEALDYIGIFDKEGNEN
jgi:hypothetical protein